MGRNYIFNGYVSPCNGCGRHVCRCRYAIRYDRMLGAVKLAYAVYDDGAFSGASYFCAGPI